MLKPSIKVVVVSHIYVMFKDKIVLGLAIGHKECNWMLYENLVKLFIYFTL